MKKTQEKKFSDFDIEQKTKSLLNLAKGSVFFPFTEPEIYSPVTGKKVSGRKTETFDVNKKIYG